MNVVKNHARWIPVIIWMGLIFYLSHQPAEQSSELSAGVMEMLLNVLVVIFPIHEEIPIIHFLIRKAAHFFAYFVLGILVVHALSKSLKPIWKGSVIALVICVLYAITDEVHQLFIPGQSGEVRDVLLDSVGAAVGLSVYLLLNRKSQ